MGLSPRRLAETATARPSGARHVAGFVLVGVALTGGLLGSALSGEGGVTSNPESKQAEELIDERFSQHGPGDEVVVVRSDELSVTAAAFRDRVTSLARSYVEVGASSGLELPRPRRRAPGSRSARPPCACLGERTWFQPRWLERLPAVSIEDAQVARRAYFDGQHDHRGVVLEGSGGVAHGGVLDRAGGRDGRRAPATAASVPATPTVPRAGWAWHLVTPTCDAIRRATDAADGTGSISDSPACAGPRQVTGVDGCSGLQPPQAGRE